MLSPIHRLSPGIQPVLIVWASLYFPIPSHRPAAPHRPIPLLHPIPVHYATQSHRTILFSHAALPPCLCCSLLHCAAKLLCLRRILLLSIQQWPHQCCTGWRCGSLCRLLVSKASCIAWSSCIIAVVAVLSPALLGLQCSSLLRVICCLVLGLCLKWLGVLQHFCLCFSDG